MDRRATTRFSRRPSLVEMVAEELRDRILKGEHRAGERVLEERLSAELGVSRPPIREAMRLLQQEGLLTAIPRKGVVVTQLTAEDVREIYAVRHALENLAVDLALPVSDGRRLEPLRVALAKLESAADAGLRSELPVLNLRFHQALARLPANSRLTRAYDALASQLQMCMALNLDFRERVSGDLRRSVRDHGELLRLIEAGDPEPVKQALQAHGSRGFLDSLENLLVPSKQPERSHRPTAVAARARRARAPAPVRLV